MTYDNRAVQARLNDLGFGPLKMDGVKGPHTDAAIVAFKRSAGLRPRPFLGPLTYDALMGEVDDGASLPWLAETVRMKGIHERRDVSLLRAWFAEGVSWIDPREVPWCGAFVATVLRKWDADIAVPTNPLGARNWGQFGQPCMPQLGAVLSFWRGSPDGWAGHVALYWGEDASAFHVLGGNQSDAVTITRVARDRLLAARWPLGWPMPGTRIRLTASGQPLSTNEL